MIFLEAQLTHFGKFHHKNIVFQPGINIIYGENEMGKSTIHSFIKGMLFGIEKPRGRSKQDIYSKYEPWENQGAYEGTLRFKQNGIVYRIERSFLKTNKYVKLIDETHGAYLEPAEEHLKKILGGLSETSYINTMSIEQMKASTDSGLLEELRIYASNLSTTKDKSINVSQAKERLKKQKREMEKRIDTTVEGEYIRILEQIETLSDELVQLRKESTQYEEEIKELKDSQHLAKKRIEEIQQALGKREEEITYELFSKKVEEEKQIALEESRKQLEKSKKKMPSIIGLLCMIALSIAVFMGANKMLEDNMIATISGVATFVLLGVVWLCIGNHSKKRTAIKEDNTHSNDETLKKVEESVRSSEEFTKTVKEQRNQDTIYKNLLDEKTKLESSIQQGQVTYAQQIEQEKKRQWIIEGKETSIVELEEEKEQIEKKKNEIVQMQKDIDAISLAIETMQDVETEIHNSFGNVLNEKISECIRLITDGKYTNVVISQGGDIFLNTKERLIPVSQVSRGTIEQIYLAIRLSACSILWGEGQMPILLDDVFAYYDDLRLKNTLEMLKSKWTGQVLIFTCHKRELLASES